MNILVIGDSFTSVDNYLQAHLEYLKGNYPQYEIVFNYDRLNLKLKTPKDEFNGIVITHPYEVNKMMGLRVDEVIFTKDSIFSGAIMDSILQWSIQCLRYKLDEK